MNPRQLPRNQAGQLIIEMILILTIFTGLSIFVASAFRDQDLLANLVQKPWASLAGMLQNGVWQDPASGRSLHPGRYDRHASREGEKAL